MSGVRYQMDTLLPEESVHVHHTVTGQVVPLVHSPLGGLLVVGIVVVEGDVATHVPEEALIILHCA